MNASGQILTWNPESEWSELLCVSFPCLFAPLLFLWCVRLIMKNAKSRKEKVKKEREKYKPTLNWQADWQGSNSRLSASCHELLAPRLGNFTTQPRNSIGVRGGGMGERGRCSSPPLNLRQLRFFGQEEKFGQSQFLKKFPCFFVISKRDIFYFNLKSTNSEFLRASVSKRG